MTYKLIISPYIAKYFDLKFSHSSLKNFKINSLFNKGKNLVIKSKSSFYEYEKWQRRLHKMLTVSLKPHIFLLPFSFELWWFYNWQFVDLLMLRVCELRGLKWKYSISLLVSVLGKLYFSLESWLLVLWVIVRLVERIWYSQDEFSKNFGV